MLFNNVIFLNENFKSLLIKENILYNSSWFIGRGYDFWIHIIARGKKKKALYELKDKPYFFGLVNILYKRDREWKLQQMITDIWERSLNFTCGNCEKNIIVTTHLYFFQKCWYGRHVVFGLLTLPETSCFCSWYVHCPIHIRYVIHHNVHKTVVYPRYYPIFACYELCEVDSKCLMIPKSVTICKFQTL